VFNSLSEGQIYLLSLSHISVQSIHEMSPLSLPVEFLLSNDPFSNPNPVIIDAHKIKKKRNTVALARKRNLPTKRPPLVGEVSANFFTC
jgi:hypothetical protein